MRVHRKAIRMIDENGDPHDVTLPAVKEVCERCDGTGRHVNPSVDGDGITGAEFAADPEFAEAYMGGVYDVTCEACNGDRVVLAVDYSTIEQWEADDRSTLAALEQQWEEDARYAQEVAHERLYGC